MPSSHDRRSRPRPVSERRVYRSNGRDGGEEPLARGDVPAGSRTVRAGRRSRTLAVAVIVLVAIVIVLIGVAAGSSALDGSQGTPATFKLLPITTTTS